ncbi:urease accessory protein UreE [Megalodesulfovibrio paquesii]
MLRLVELLRPDPAVAVQDTLTLPFDQRVRSRFKTVSDGGRALGLFLERGHVLQEGELLRAESGELLRVHCALEDLISAECEDWDCFAKACFHLGNRHVVAEIGERRIRFQPDHVVEVLVCHLGLRAVAVRAAFNPEPGAYFSGFGHGAGIVG